MAKKAVVSGQFNLVDEATNRNILSFDLAAVYPPLTSILEFNDVERQISSADGVVSLDKGGVTNLRGFFITIREGQGPITLKHDSNTAGIVITGSLLFFGKIDAITVETASAQPVTIEYVFFE